MEGFFSFYELLELPVKQIVTSRYFAGSKHDLVFGIIGILVCGARDQGL